MFQELSPIHVIVLAMVLGILPIALTLVTSYIKIIVVAFIVRNALGIQQTPPNMVLTGLAVILSIFIMAPVGFSAYHNIENYVHSHSSEELNSVPHTLAIVETAATPFLNFLAVNTDDKIAQSFANTAQRIWPQELRDSIAPDSWVFLVPSFVISELTKAFQIGFLLYLPFIIIDLIVSNILLAMGMMMVSPTTISLPFKLMLFVTIDGWLKLSQGLMLSYSY